MSETCAWKDECAPPRVVQRCAFIRAPQFGELGAANCNSFTDSTEAACVPIPTSYKTLAQIEKWCLSAWLTQLEPSRDPQSPFCTLLSTA